MLGAYGAKHIVIGHTPSLQGIIIQYDGRLARIDTGNSRYYDGPLELARDRRRHADSPHGEKVGAMKPIRLALRALSPSPFRRRPAASAADPLFASSDPIQLDDQGAACLPRCATAIRQAPVSGVLVDPERAKLADQSAASRNYPPDLGNLRFRAAARRLHRAAAGDVPVRRAEEVEAGHPLPQFGVVPAICAARICRLPSVQPAHAAELPGAAREHHYQGDDGRPIASARRLLHRGPEGCRQAQGIA